MKASEEIKKIKRGCGLVTNRGKCGIKGYLCCMCKERLKYYQNYKPKLRLTRVGLIKMLKKRLKKEILKIIEEVDRIIIGKLYGMRIDIEDYDKIVKEWKELKQKIKGEEK